ncbi:MAG TPA: DNA replication protein, partial [Myxococcales bacterium]|nr:DNA replication protein [Myxococcales bacterium]
GPPGVGKTHLMVGFLRHVLLERGIPCRFQDFGVLLAELRSSYTNGLSEMEILRGLINVDVLLIDDLGKGRNSKWESGIIDTLISCRYNTKRTTLITTNYTQELETTLRERYRGRGSTEGEELLMRDTLADRVGERVYSRLREMCDFFFISGVDYRQR